MNSTERAFSEIITSTVSKDSSVLVAFSGGCDSLCLLALCAKVLGPSRTFAVYVNHNIRNEEELSAEICLNQANCRALGVGLEVCTLEPGLVQRTAESRGGGIEDAARFLRYQALENRRKEHGCSYILTAHHRQDQVETIVMRLGRGAPLSSLKGIAALDEKRHLMRPLLDFPRMDLECYVRSLGLEWSTDSTNSDSSYLRNHIRNEVVPTLGTILPDFEDLLLDLGRKAKGFDSAIPMETLGDSIALSVFSDLGPVESSDILFRIWNQVFPGSDLPQALVSRVLKAIRKGEDCRIGSHGAIFCLYHQNLHVVNPADDNAYQAFERQVDVTKDQKLELLAGMVLRSGAYADEVVSDPENGLDPNRILRMDSTCFHGRCTIRYARIGDCIRLKDGSRMVMRLLQDMKIPSCLRKRVPVLVDEDGICAVFGSFYGHKDRICVKFRSSLAPNRFTQYIVSKG